MALCRPSNLGPTTDVPEPDQAVLELLDMLRARLRMDVAWLGRLEADRLVMQVFSGDPAPFPLVPGSTVVRETALYEGILSGRLPSVIPDTRADPRTANLPAVVEMGVGAYAAVPVVDGENEMYGILGCAAFASRPALRERDGRLIRLLAEVLGDSVVDLHRMWECRSTCWQEISELIDAGGPTLVFQPVFDLRTGRMVAVEALSRFPDPSRSPQQWFAAAGSVGLSTELELAALRRALDALPELPVEISLSCNASPTTLVSGLLAMVGEVAADRLIVEITEHESIAGNPSVHRGVDRLRSLGARIAADDVGTGFSGLEQLVALRPEIIKMDCCLTRGIDVDPARRAVAAGLVHVARETGSAVVAEGIETPGELAAALDTEIPYGQGYLLGRPTRHLDRLHPAALHLHRV